MRFGGRPRKEAAGEKCDLTATKPTLRMLAQADGKEEVMSQLVRLLSTTTTLHSLFQYATARAPNSPSHICISTGTSLLSVRLPLHTFPPSLLSNFVILVD
ncbi:hypothetical protein KC349_g135 [Hortaea werneckii]|nr:hypothetical protein KC349_g135 [Hortaea werneckii]